ncbi:MAG TPA: hypothetical protein VMR49_02515 [Candidatus Paceibacterota bacterium]|jgi:hypothetical protein|nr:hypothetical protein [Candidatus Paceibacterota bacterium]
MSYSDDEIEINSPDEEDDDLDIDADLGDGPLDDDLLVDDEEEAGDFADLNGNEY